MFVVVGALCFAAGCFFGFAAASLWMHERMIRRAQKNAAIYGPEYRRFAA